MKPKLLEEIKAPEWWTKLDGVPPLPPKPYGGWGRWWRDNSDQLWMLLFLAGTTLAVYVVQEIYSEAKARRLRRLFSPAVVQDAASHVH